MTKVAFLGLGAMGQRMAGRLLEAGHALTVFNRTRASGEDLVSRGARWADTPAAAAADADVVLTMLTDDEAARAVWCGAEGALGALKPGAVCIESSTVSPRFIAELQTAVTEAGGELLDAPVAGSRPQAEAGALVFLAGGTAANIDKAQGLLSTMGSVVHHCGPVGTGAVMKLMVNGLFAAQVGVLAELLALGEDNGIAGKKALEILGQMPVTSPAAKGVGGLMIAGNHAPMFPIDLVVKDLRYAEKAAQGHDGVLAGTRRLYEAAQKAGLGDKNISGVALHAGAR